MLPPIPKPEDYAVSPETGFLPSEPPLQFLTHPCYDRWERVIANFQSLLLTKRIRAVIDGLPIIPTSHLYKETEWRRAYSILCFMAHGYIWGGHKPTEREPIASLENLSALTTFTGSIDEQWFYLVSVAFEARSGPTIPLMLDAIAAARFHDSEAVTCCLEQFAEVLDDLGNLLLRMYESCDPHVFYNRIRPFLAGSKNMGEAGLPNGVLYDDGSRNPTRKQYGGGSNAQSSIIQFFDIVLGIEHRPTGEKKDETSESEGDSKPRHNFIHEMRSYMPGPHRRFLEAVESVANIREYVEDNKSDRNLVVAFDGCLAMLRALRDKHMQMVSRYIIVKSRETRSQSRGRALSSEKSSSQTVNLASARRVSSNQEKPKKALRGTGGTALMSFLKQARDEVGEPVVDDWVRRYMKHGRTAADIEIQKEDKAHRELLEMIGEHPDEDFEIPGLAASWAMTDSEGGLCSY
ncbi:MAG: hypothetical protein Q9227_006752 [Pyrenula ochraceoflavens]